STSSSPSNSAWSSMSIHAKTCCGMASASACSLGLYCSQVSHQAAQKHATSQVSGDEPRRARSAAWSVSGTSRDMWADQGVFDYHTRDVHPLISAVMTVLRTDSATPEQDRISRAGAGA